VASDTAFPPVGNIKDWRRLVGRLSIKCKASLNINVKLSIADRLHKHLWDSIRTELKKDLAADGRAYAALHLAFMGDVLAMLHTLVELPREQTQLTRELLEELRAQKERHVDPKARELAEHLTQTDPVRALTLFQRFDQLSGKLDSQYQRVLGELATMHSKIDLIIGTLTPELERLRTELEAAVRRAVEAEARGDTKAARALDKAREHGDRKALGAFLDQQLAEKQSNMIALLRERAAVAYVSGEIDRAKQCLEQILVTLPDDPDATNELGHIYQLRGNLDAAERQYRRLLELAPNDDEAKAAALGNPGLIYRTRGQVDQAEQFLRDALAINTQLGRLVGQASQLGNLGVIAKARGDLAEARRLWTEARDLFARVGARPQQALVQSWLDALPPQ